MLINRHNYEEFFLLYVDNELSVAERKAVESFVEENPDLEEELVMMMQSVLRPDKNVVFSNKGSLLKNKSVKGLVNESNYEEYFVLYGDNELTNEEKDLVEQFVYKHPQYQAEFELIQQARLIPEATIYPDKNELYRTERDERVIPFAWWRIAAAAMVLLFLGVTAWYMTKTELTPGNGKDPVVAEGKNNSVDTNTAVVKENAVKEDKKTIERIVPAVDTKQNIAAVKKAEKNIKKESNIPVIPNVQQERPEEIFVDRTSRARSASVTGVETSAEPITVDASVVASKDPGTAMNNTGKEVYYYIDGNSNDDDIKLANASINKKPVRGLIRKVKGLFEGNNEDEDANDPKPEGKKGIRIAAFQVSLK